MPERKIALKVNDKDNVATIFANNVSSGDKIEIRDKKGTIDYVNIHESIPYGHKIAVKDICIGEDIIKYGEEIGIATIEIKKGDYVHIHNLDSKRGRGDWKEET